MTLFLLAGRRLALAVAITFLLGFVQASCSCDRIVRGLREANNDAGLRGGQKHSYRTNFPAAENPISEAGQWINGGTTGRDWGSVNTTPGLAFGTNVSAAPPFDDPTAVLAGNWASKQMAQATVYTVNQTHAIVEEVELRLRTTTTPHRITGYEFVYRVTSDGSQYTGIVRWNGALNDFTYLRSNSCTKGGPGLHHGDTVMAAAIAYRVHQWHKIL